MKQVNLIFLMFVFSIVCFNSFADVEVQIPFDEDNKLNEIDKDIEQELDLYPDVSGFQEALLFQVNDSTFVLEITFIENNRIHRKRQELSLSEMEALRLEINSLLKSESPQVYLDQSGRAEFITGTMALSLGFYGWAVPATFHMQSAQGITASYMLIGAAGFLGPYHYTKDKQVTDAAAILSIYGGTRGIAHGVSLAGIFSEEPDVEPLLALGILTSLAEMNYFFHYANNSGMTTGTADAIGAYGDFGIGWGLGITHLLGFWEDKPQAVNAGVLAGSIAGLWSGNKYSRNQVYSQGDAYMLRASGFLGAYLPVALLYALDADDKLLSASAVAGSIGGLMYGHNQVKNRDLSLGDGVLIQLSEVAGGLVGLGTAFLISDEFDDSVYFLSSAAGAAVGYGLMKDISFKKSSRKTDVSFNLDINPYGVLSLATGENKSNNTILNVGLRF